MQSMSYLQRTMWSYYLEATVSLFKGRAFLRRVNMFSPYLRGFPLGAPVFCTIKNIYIVLISWQNSVF